MKKKKTVSLLEIGSVITKRRRLIIKTASLAVFSTMIISLLIRNQYTATATILPPNPQQEAMLGMINPGVYSAYSSFTGLGGIIPGATSLSDLFAAILSSGEITGRIISKFNLTEVFKCKKRSDAAKMLKSITKIGVTPEGIISVSVTWYDKFLAADIANSYIEELDKFNTETAMTTGKKYRLFIEERLLATSDSLLSAEEALRNFQEKHRTIALDIEVQSIIETIAELKSQIILLEVKKGTLAASSQTTNPYLYNINKQLIELRKQLTKIEHGDETKQDGEFGAGFSVPLEQVPEVLLEYARLMRDVKVQEAIYELLTQQYEQAKIVELKDTPTIQTLDKAGPPEEKSSPRRSRMVVLAFIASVILSIAAVFMLEAYERFKLHGDEYSQWLTISRKISGDLRSLKKTILDLFRQKKH